MQDYEHRYQKLGGWLLVIVVVTFIGAFGVVLNLFSEDGFLRFASGYAGVKLWMELLIQACMLYEGIMQVIYAVMIIQRDPRFGRTWQLKFIGNVLRTLAKLILHVAYGFPPRAFGSTDVTFSFGLTNDIFAFLPFLLFVALIALYLKKSVRVRTYMGTNKYLRLMLFTKNAEGPEPMVPDREPEEAPDGEQ